MKRPLAKVGFMKVAAQISSMVTTSVLSFLERNIMISKQSASSWLMAYVVGLAAVMAVILATVGSFLLGSTALQQLSRTYVSKSQKDLETLGLYPILIGHNPKSDTPRGVSDGQATTSNIEVVEPENEPSPLLAPISRR